MPWQVATDTEPEPDRKARVCVVCRKIILRADDLHVRAGKVYCTKHVARHVDAS